MSSIYDEQSSRIPMGRVWRAEIASDPDDLDSRVDVIIPELDRRLKVKDCRWQSRDATSLPSPGDACLVVFDNNMEPWVVAWWPF